MIETLPPASRKLLALVRTAPTTLAEAADKLDYSDSWMEACMWELSDYGLVQSRHVGPGRTLEWYAVGVGLHAPRCPVCHCIEPEHHPACDSRR